jgi:hypothetical protein
MMHCPDSRGLSLGWFCLLVGLAHLQAAAASPATRYERLFRESQAAFESQPTNAEAAWKYARACYDWSEFATNKDQRIELANMGIAAGRRAVSLQPKAAPGHYYLGINLGTLADATRGLAGLKLVSEMESRFQKAGELEPEFDYAGPDRCLGLLYRDAPGWPVSVGSRAKARQHLERARQLSGDYPENMLNLLETWLKWGEKSKVLAQVPAVDQTLAEARKKFTGEAWASSWAGWDRTWRRIRTKAGAAAQSTFQHKGDS